MSDAEPPSDPAGRAADDAAAEADAVPVRHVFRWDLDKTYLRTDFDTIKDLIRTALQKPEEKVNVPGAVALLRELTRESDEGRAVVTFISGSPSQMRATLERKFELDGIRPDAFVLKPTLENILAGRFRAVRGQVGYKLSTLLRIRQMHTLAPETLFGDDAEQDAFIYSLYADVVSEKIDRDGLLEVLAEAKVYEETVETIVDLHERTTFSDNVQRVFIHLDRHSPPGRFWVFGPRVVPIANYFQASLVLYADGVLTADGLIRVAHEMIGSYDYGLMDLANSLQDLARRRHVELGMLDRLARQAASSPERHTLPPGFLERLVDRVRALAPRTQSPPRHWEGPVDYIEVLRADQKLRETVQEKKSGLFGS